MDPLGPPSIIHVHPRPLQYQSSPRPHDRAVRQETGFCAKILTRWRPMEYVKDENRPDVIRGEDRSQRRSLMAHL